KIPIRVNQLVYVKIIASRNGGIYTGIFLFIILVMVRSTTYKGTAVGILTLVGGTDLVSLTSPVTPIQLSVLIKSTDTVLMALGRKGLTCG
ncbi:unnamed protein product, partial [Staurois parvus]